MSRGLAPALLLVVLTVGGCGGPRATPAPEAAPAAQELTIVAANLAFEPATLGAPSGVPLHVVLEHTDAGIPHSVALYAGPAFATELAATEVVVGPASLAMDIPGLVPGVYQFRCVVHPNMTTKLQVGG